MNVKEKMELQFQDSSWNSFSIFEKGGSPKKVVAKN